MADVEPPSLVEVRAYLGVPVATLSDPLLERMREACLADQADRCNVEPYSDQLGQALIRRVQRELAAKALPLGLVGLDSSEYGPARLPYFDALVEEHERGRRRVVLA